MAFIRTGLGFIAGQRHFKLQKYFFFKTQNGKTNDKVGRFGIVMTPLRRKKFPKMKITAFKVILARRINIPGCEDYENTFAQIESNYTLRFNFKAFHTLSSQIKFPFVHYKWLTYFTSSSTSARNKEAFGIVAEAVNNDYGGVERCPWSPAQLRG